MIRHVPRLAGVVLAVAASVAGGWWLIGHRTAAPAAQDASARPSLRAGEVYGIDVSSHQGGIEWRRVADDDIGFAYIKATEGGDFTDARFAENWAGAEAAGVARGAYHFFTLCRPGRDQVEHFLRTVPADPGALTPAVDLELIGNCAQRPSPAAVAAELDAFLERVEAAWGRPALLYVGPEWQARYPTPASAARPQWVKDGDRPSPPWAIWQLRALASVDGIAGLVDLDVGRPQELAAMNY